MKLECSHYNDARRSYLVVKCSGDSGNYQYRMLAANRIDGLIPCSLRSIDGSDYLYYEITGRQSMESVFGQGNVKAEAIKSFLYTLASAGSGITRFLLDDSRILLHEAYIFYDFNKEAWLFCYYPEQTDESSAEKLLKYLTDHADPEDTTAVSALRRLHSRACQPNFFLTAEVLDSEFDGRISALELIEKIERENLEAERARQAAREHRRRSYSRREDPERDNEEMDEPQDASRPDGRRAGTSGMKKRRPALLLLISLGFLSAALAFDVITVYAASSFGLRGRVLMRAAAAASLMLAAMAAVYGLFLSLRKNGEEDEDSVTAGTGREPELIPTDEREAESITGYIGGYRPRRHQESDEM